MKKVICMIIALVMIASLSTAAFAAETGTITINGISEGNVYEIYKLLDLESYDIASGAYSYKVNSAWTGFFATAGAQAYMIVDDAGYATWVGEENGERVAAFAKLALAYAKDNGIAPVKSSSVVSDREIYTDVGGTGKLTLRFSGLELGYYLVDSTMGALCGLTTTNPNASINAKNGSPTIDKQVQEDSTSQWGNNNTADIGQLVHFRVTIDVHSGAENYALHDKMSAGLTFVEVEKVVHIIPTADGHTETVADLGYYTVVQSATDGCSFEVRFTQAFCDHLQTNDKVVIYYTAKLNESAAVGNGGNNNEAWLEYGDDHYTTHDSTVTKTFGFDLVKTDSQNILLDGAEFRIYDAATGGNEVKVVEMADGTYRRAEAGEKEVNIVVKDGKVRVVGFDNGTYYLEEVVTPAGYNQLTARQRFIISDGNLDALFNDGIFSTGSGVQVVNKSGTMLPETGGIGTVLFVAFGTMTVLGAGVLLVTKKRMGMIEE